MDFNHLLFLWTYFITGTKREELINYCHTVNNVMCIIWKDVRCSTDTNPQVEDGLSPDIGRFPWLGVVQHSFYLAGGTQHAITAGILIHPGYVIAAADDIVKIPHEIVSNSTKYIAWYSEEDKYVMDVKDYVLHPEYTEKVTFATIALLELITYGETGLGGNPYPVLPVCMPLEGAGSIDSNLYVVKLTEENAKIQKEVFHVTLVDNKDCEDFYVEHELSTKMTTPTSPTCVTLERKGEPCVWDAGAALITRQSWGHWILVGVGTRGAGCGAPARFLSLSDYLPWIDDVISAADTDSTQHEQFLFTARRISPIQIIMYPESQILIKEQGQCDRDKRGPVLYKDNYEVTTTRNFGQGFYFVVIHDIMQVSCLVVNLVQVTSKSNAAIWLEHNCHKEISGLAVGHARMREYKKDQCFIYFKTSAFLQYRFYFSFKAVVESTVYGHRERARVMPNPFKRTETTEVWWPTTTYFNWDNFYLRRWWWSFTYNNI